MRQTNGPAPKHAGTLVGIELTSDPGDDHGYGPSLMGYDFDPELAPMVELLLALRRYG